ncbi:GtrA family protein [Xenorhabdus szentirmaii]|uniref:GtrA family protein n=1 Tax=Xenorhabdus szentirmaii TaxID=290112 RepID=UPI000571FCC7|nr:GtrA family protein [Xenorhabdus szentirmaii]
MNFINKFFAKYVTIGIINTLIHWGTFGILFYVINTTQSIANLIGFIISVTFSFLANAKFTFEKKATARKYIFFITFMGSLSFLLGHLSDHINLYPLFTLLFFSIVSLILGFLYSKIFIFKE